MSLWDPRNVPPYPPARYTNDEPEVSAWLRRGTDPPDSTRRSAEVPLPCQPASHRGRLRPLPRRHRTEGGGASPHFHRTISEAFFVLSGTLRLYDGNEWIDGHPNDFLYVPPGGIHGFRNEADEPTSFLILFAPGAPREAYFEGMAQLADLTDDERKQWFIDNDNIFLD